jgi:hypothetical protein
MFGTTMKHHLQTFWRNWIAKDWAVQRCLIIRGMTLPHPFYLSNKYAPSVYWSVRKDEAYSTWRWHANSVANQLTKQQGDTYTFKVVNLKDEAK